MMLPYQDITVVDLSENLAGPFCTQILGDLGADVIKVERPGTGDPARAWGPPFWGGESPLFLAGNRNKQSLVANLKTADGRGVVRQLAAEADVFVHSFRAGVIESFGLEYEQLQSLNSKLVYCSIAAFGVRGPRKDHPGYDPLLQAYGGLMSVTGHPGQPPVRVGTSVMDISTGMWASLGILAALKKREETGQGTEVVASLFDTALTWISYHLMGYLGTGEVPGKEGSGLGMIVPYEAFPTADGHLMIAAGNDTLFGNLCEALGIPERAEDERFQDNPSRVTHREALFEILAERTRQETTVALERRLQAAGVPAAPIQTIDAVAEDPQVAANRMLMSGNHPRIPDFQSVALPVEWDGSRVGLRHAPPCVGQHTNEVLSELGYSTKEIEELSQTGAIQQHPDFT